MNLTASHIVGGLVLLALCVLLVHRKSKRRNGGVDGGGKSGFDFFDGDGDGGGD